MTIPPVNRKIHSLLFLFMAGALNGCSTSYDLKDTVVWVSTTNTCHAAYRHVWSDVEFSTLPSAVPVNILLPLSSIRAGANDGQQTAGDINALTTANQQKGSQTTDRLGAVQTDRQAESEVDSTKAVADQRQRASSAERMDAQVGSDMQAADQEAQAINKQTRSQTTTSEDDGEAAFRESAGRHREQQSAGFVAASQTGKTVRESHATGRQTAHALSTTQHVDKSMSVASHQAMRSRLSAKADTSLAVATGVLKDSTVSEHHSFRAAQAELANLQASSFPSAAGFAEVMPALSLQKDAPATNVLAGRSISFVITLSNPSPIELHDIIITDPVPSHLRLKGIKYGWLERFLPFLRNVVMDSPDTFRVRKRLKPAEVMQFTVKYRCVEALGSGLD